MADITVRPNQETVNRLRALAKEAGPTVKRRVDRGLRQAGDVGAAAARAAVLAANPPKADQRTAGEKRTLQRKRFGSSHQHTGLRANIAKGIRVSLSRGSQGIRVVSTNSALPPSQKSMNRVYRLATFRHPVFGKKDTWAQQHGADFFYGPIGKTRGEMRSAVEEAMRKAADDLAGM